jgi:predicted cupin superfamily sugar epimerase
VSEAEQIIRALMLSPHPEGGHYRETFRDGPNPDGRAHSTTILFLLKSGEESRWHRIDAAEMWHFYRGAPLELLVAEETGEPTRHVLGNQVEHGQSPQIAVPTRAWQAARTLGAYTLAGCTVAPGFSFERFELASGELAQRLNTAIRPAKAP